MRGIWCASLSGEREAEKLRDVLQKFLQALARWVLDQHLRIAIFRNPAFVEKDQARSYFLGKTDFVCHDHHRHPFFSQILHNLQHFMARTKKRRKNWHVSCWRKSVWQNVHITTLPNFLVVNSSVWRLPARWR